MAWKGEHGSAGEQFALALIGLFPIVAMVAAVLVQSKYVAALAQLGSLFERERVYDEHQSAVSGGESDTAAPETRFRASTVIRDRAESTAKRAVKAADKLYFVLGVLNVALTAYLVGAAPQYFHLWHTPKALFLVSLRWWTFMKEGKHWLLADFCYWANLIGLVFLWVFPSNALLFQIFFMVSNGPVAWSVLAFNQSLVFHSHAHMTSVFLHFSPIIVSWALRWRQPPNAAFVVCDTDAGCWRHPLGLWWDGTRYFYLPWIVGYYLLVYIVLGDFLKRNAYQTLFDRVTTSGPSAKIFRLLFRRSGVAGPLAQRAVYMSVHLVFGMVTMGLATIYWYSYFAHSAFLVTIFAASVYNAAGYYFTVFAQRYEREVAETVSKAKFQ